MSISAGAELLPESPLSGFFVGFVDLVADPKKVG